MPRKKTQTDEPTAAETSAMAAPEPTIEAVAEAPAKTPRKRTTKAAAESASTGASTESVAEAPAKTPRKRTTKATAEPVAESAVGEAPAKPSRPRAAKAAAKAVAEPAPIAVAASEVAEPAAIVESTPAVAVESVATPPAPVEVVETPVAAVAAEAPAAAVAVETPAVSAADAAPAAETDAAPAKADVQRRGRPRTRLEDVVIGTALHGKVVGLRPFGVFVDIGAMTDGLVHITEFPKKGVRKVEDVVKNGDSVDVWVKDVDASGNRISLTMRRPAQRPLTALAVGDVLTGTVTSLTQYGAFIDVGSDTEGLVHVSEMSSGYVKKPDDIIRSGESVEVRIKEIDHSRQRISLSMVGLANDSGFAAAQAEAAEAQAASRARAEARAQEADIPAEPEERQPTVVELALRRALGQIDEGSPVVKARPAAQEKGSRKGSDRKGGDRDMGDVYTRMIADYRASKSAEK